MEKLYRREYNFYPQTWLLPQDSQLIKQELTQKKGSTFIIKPDAASQGYGIFLANDWKSIKHIEIKLGSQYVVQKYMQKPYLIDGLKFDLRIYCLVYGVDPLRVFVFREGLARFATEMYVEPNSKNLHNLHMHLTNYAINKFAENFEENEDSADDDQGHKRSISSIFKLLEQNEPPSRFTAKNMWEQIDDIVVKTMISVQP